MASMQVLRRLARVASLPRVMTPIRFLAAAPRASIRVTFILPDGSARTVDAPVGDSMLEVAHANKIDIEACSTCHVYVDSAFLKKLPEASEAEEDMLDLAAGLKDNSRLGCQVVAAPELDGMTVTMPKEVNNMMSKE